MGNPGCHLLVLDITLGAMPNSLCLFCGAFFFAAGGLWSNVIWPPPPQECGRLEFPQTDGISFGAKCLVFPDVAQIRR